MRVHRATDISRGRIDRPLNNPRIQEERRQLRNLIATLAPYRPAGLETLAPRTPGDGAFGDGSDDGDRLMRAGAAGWVGPV